MAMRDESGAVLADSADELLESEVPDMGDVMSQDLCAFFFLPWFSLSYNGNYIDDF